MNNGGHEGGEFFSYGYRGFPRILFLGMFEQEETELTEPATLCLLRCLLFKTADMVTN